MKNIDQEQKNYPIELNNLRNKIQKIQELKPPRLFANEWAKVRRSEILTLGLPLLTQVSTEEQLREVFELINEATIMHEHGSSKTDQNQRRKLKGEKIVLDDNKSTTGIMHCINIFTIAKLDYLNIQNRTDKSIDILERAQRILSQKLKKDYFDLSVKFAGAWATWVMGENETNADIRLKKQLIEKFEVKVVGEWKEQSRVWDKYHGGRVHEKSLGVLLKDLGTMIEDKSVLGFPEQKDQFNIICDHVIFLKKNFLSMELNEIKIKTSNLELQFKSLFIEISKIIQTRKNPKQKASTDTVQNPTSTDDKVQPKKRSENDEEIDREEGSEGDKDKKKHIIDKLQKYIFDYWNLIYPKENFNSLDQFLIKASVKFPKRQYELSQIFKEIQNLQKNLSNYSLDKIQNKSETLETEIDTIFIDIIFDYSVKKKTISSDSGPINEKHSLNKLIDSNGDVVEKGFFSAKRLSEKRQSINKLEEYIFTYADNVSFYRKGSIDSLDKFLMMAIVKFPEPKKRQDLVELFGEIRNLKEKISFYDFDTIQNKIKTLMEKVDIIFNNVDKQSDGYRSFLQN